MTNFAVKFGVCKGYPETPCKKHGIKETWITKPSLELCDFCNQIRLMTIRGGRPLPRKALSKKRSKTGELEVFVQIFEERRGRSEITGDSLIFDVRCFAHVLNKDVYERWRLNKMNILLVESRFHTLYDHSTKDKALIEFPNCEWVYLYHDKLKAQYNQENQVVDQLAIPLT